MASKNVKRVPMSKENRAKQFMPFAALKGYEEALQKTQKRVEERYERQNHYNSEKEKDEPS